MSKGSTRPRWQLTARDLSILSFVLRFGVATAEQVRREFFGSSPNAAYRRLKALSELGLLRSERVFFGEPGIYVVTEPGAKLAGADLPPPRRLRERVHHAIEMIELSHLLRHDEFEEVEEWISEREIRRDRMISRREERNGRMLPGGPMVRIPDGIMILSDGSEVAVELELTPKRKANYRRIFDSYERQFEDGRLDSARFYFTSKQALKRVEAICGHHAVYRRVDFRHYEPQLRHRR